MTDTSNLRQQLASRAEGTSQAVATVPADISPATLVRKAIENQARAFKAVLPSVVDPQRFSRLVLTAVKATPDLMRCFETKQGETSVLLAAMQAAAIGLEPNTPTQDCWLLPRRNQGTWECQLSIGYRGYMRLARRSGTIKTIFAEVVRERDHFRWERGLEADVLEHRPYDGADDAGELTHAYAVARFDNGGYSFMVLNRRQVEQRRAMSDSWKSEKARPYSPWTKWTDAMWRKSAVRALVPYLDLSADVAGAMEADEASGYQVNTEEGTIDVLAYEDTPAELDAAPPDVDDETGEVVGTAADDETVAPLAVDEPTTVPTGGEGSGASSSSTPEPELPDAMTDPQSKALHALLRRKFGASGPARFPVLNDLLGRDDIESTKQLTVAEASRCIDLMNDLPDERTGPEAA